MTNQRGITVIELAIIGAYLAIVVTATVYGGKAFGVWGIVAALAVGVD